MAEGVRGGWLSGSRSGLLVGEGLEGYCFDTHIAVSEIELCRCELLGMQLSAHKGNC